MLLHLIGAAVGYAGRPIGLKRSIGGAGKVRKHCGVQLSKSCFNCGVFQTQEDDDKIVLMNEVCESLSVIFSEYRNRNSILHE